MKTFFNLAFLLILFSCNSVQYEKPLDPSQTLWYDQPAKNWTEALPVGNGRIGAMVYGKTGKEIIQFNEETLWTGQPKDYAHPGAHKYLDTMRELLWEGKQKEAEDLGNQQFMSQPFRQLSYQPFGNITLDFHGHDPYDNYKRQLDLTEAICKTAYSSKGITFTREIFSSAPDQALIMHVAADRKGALNVSVGMNSPHKHYTVKVEDDVIIISGTANNYSDRKGKLRKDYPESKMTFEARLKIINNGGSLIKKKTTLEVEDADAVTLMLVAATNFVNYHDISADPAVKCMADLKSIEGRSFKQIKQNHIKEYQAYYKRVNLDLGQSSLSLRPTNERLKSFKQDEDPNLVALLYQYGRYLLISSSRPGTQPANLQGIWNDQLAPAWDSKYTININAEMNYWPAEITNLSELAEPIINLTEDLSITGKKVAKEHYNLEGWVAHHNTDLWRGAAPINGSNHGIWPTGGAWLCEHLWWHYQFTGDHDYLEKKAYPMMKEAARFFVNYLVPDKNNPEWLISGPSNSPENGGLVMGPTMDHQIIRNLLANTIEAAEILGKDAGFVKLMKAKRSKIAPNQIGKYGQLQEWLEDKDNPRNLHRHVSHLWGLHPGNEIHPLTTPELADACKVTLSHRGDGGTGWSRAWKINFWARLLDGDHSFLLLKNLMIPAGEKSINYQGGGGLYANLFDAHPPFQIDGNFGATSGITEMLLQSHLRDEKGNYYQDILPALPSVLSSGSVKGIKGRNGFEISISWENGILTEVKVKSLLGKKLLLRYNGKVILRETEMDKDYLYRVNDFK